MAKDAEHAHIRRALNPAFSQRALLEQEPILLDHVNLLMARLAEATRKQHSINIRQWYTFSMFDVTSDLAFGEDLECVRRGAYHE